METFTNENLKKKIEEPLLKQLIGVKPRTKRVCFENESVCALASSILPL